MKINFDKNTGLVPAIIQNYRSKQVLMLGYMNQESLEKTLESAKVCFFSRSKNRLWTKGEESGNFLHLIDLKIDCDGDTLLIQVQPEGPTCHKGTTTCWGEDYKVNYGFLSELESVINSRWEDESEDKSYVKFLKAKGLDKIIQKVGEEAVEVVIESKNENEELLLNESADLLFHLMLLFKAKSITLDQVINVLINRNEK
ncbi:bifunctional phosphoribosyl-AMP cyclohydrolase/phosphoribosyl-ATP diphosphatase HisIE [Flavobacteriaceae bacterium]|nr:bifunctional phosphoribosyl-AMP cyclohydrolase/phosphoribosyl-ATP diphosphatase HisIE [Flavobacteriaceae bacterium]